MNKTPLDSSSNVLYFNQKIKKKLEKTLHYPITIVNAPMGYGKTTAIQAYLNEQQIDTIWISVSRVRKTSFWNQFCDGFQRVFPQHAEIAEALRELGFPKDTSSFYKAKDVFARAKILQQFVVVIDDYHLINTSSVCNFWERIMKERIRNFHIILLTRERYCGNIEGLRLKDQVHLIEKDSFVFSKEDIVSYFRAHGIDLNEDDAEEIHKNTDGWVSALYFYQVKMQEEGILAFPSSIFEIIEEEIYSPLSEDCKHLLLCLSPLHSFTLEQATFVFGDSRAGDLILSLCEKNGFITFDDYQQRYRMHQTLALYLAKKLERSSVETRKEVYCVCGDYCKETKNYYSALAHYSACEEFERCVQLLEEDFVFSIRVEQWKFIEGIMNQCPLELKAAYPYAIFKLAANALLINEIKSYWRYRSILKKECLEHEETEKRKILCFLSFLTALENYNDLEKMTLHFEAAIEHYAEEALVTGSSASFWTMGSPSALYMFHRTSGQLQTEIVWLQRAIKAYDILTGKSGAGGDLLMLAESYYQQGDFETAKIHLFDAEATVRQRRKAGSISLCIDFLKLRIALAHGDGELVKKMTEELEASMREDISGKGILTKTCELCLNHLHASLGMYSMIPDLVQSDKKMELIQYGFSYPFYQMVFGLYLLESEDYTRLIGTFKALLREKMYQKHVIFQIQALIYIAVALHKIGRSSEAEENLLTAMELSFPDNIIMPFVEHFLWIEPLLVSMGEAERYREEIGQIKQIASQYRENRKQVRSYLLNPKNELTKREAEMAMLACKGYSNRDIADELFLAQSTVKRAMVDIFKKLKISTRTELGLHRDKFEEKAHKR